MKKSILALTVASLFSGLALAKNVVDHNDIYVERSDAEKLTVDTAANGKQYLFSDGKIVGEIEFDEFSQSAIIKGTHSSDVDRAFVNYNEDGSVRMRVDTKDGDHHMANVDIKIDQDRNNGQNNHIEERLDAQAKGLEKALDYAVNENKDIVINGEKYTTEQVRDMTNDFKDMTKEERRQIMSAIKFADRTGLIENVELEDNNANHGENKVIIDDSTRQSLDEIYKTGAIAQSTLESNTGRITNLENQMKEMGNKMLVLEDRMDGVVASSHAITNARPVLNSAGQFGMGVGIGAAGSKQAIAIGSAYQFNENWSGSMSVNYETKGKVSQDQLSAGVGAQYIF